MSQLIDVAIVGAKGFGALELIKILYNHPYFNIKKLVIKEEERETLSNIHPMFDKVFDIEVGYCEPSKLSKEVDLIFLALPHKSSMEWAKELLKDNKRVIDLSADYRLSLENYEKYYSEHIDSNNLDIAIYGLVEYFREEIKSAKLVALPGCYPTATLLALLPFVDYLDNSFPIIIDAKSGVSGAGRKLSTTTHFVTINENIFAYNPLIHRHEPEIKEKVFYLSKKEFDINFVPHLIPITRGELVSIYGILKEDINPFEVLQKRYKDERFVRVKDRAVDVKSVAGTHFCDIFATKKKKTLFISSAIDNLVRGTASNGVACANLMYGFDEGLGLPQIAYMP